MLPAQVSLANRIFGEAKTADHLDRSNGLEERSLASQC